MPLLVPGVPAFVACSAFAAAADALAYLAGPACPAAVRASVLVFAAVVAVVVAFVSVAPEFYVFGPGKTDR